LSATGKRQSAGDLAAFKALILSTIPASSATSTVSDVIFTQTAAGLAYQLIVSQVYPAGTTNKLTTSQIIASMYQPDNLAKLQTQAKALNIDLNSGLSNIQVSQTQQLLTSSGVSVTTCNFSGTNQGLCSTTNANGVTSAPFTVAPLPVVTSTTSSPVVTITINSGLKIVPAFTLGLISVIISMFFMY